MSLLDLILAQKGILLSIGLALLLLLAAAVLTIAARVRRLVRQRASARPITQEASLEESPDEAQPVNPPETAEARPVQPAPSQPVEQAKPIMQTSQPAQQAEQPEQPEDSQPSAMQDILSSVFSDDEADARRETLLNGLDSVASSHLLALCNQVANQLRAAGR